MQNPEPPTSTTSILDLLPKSVYLLTSFFRNFVDLALKIDRISVIDHVQTAIKEQSIPPVDLAVYMIVRIFYF